MVLGALAASHPWEKAPPEEPGDELTDPFDIDAADPDAAQIAKANIARYRGAACGVKYAEALWAMNAQAVEIL